jgi:hypothetical protein
MFFKCQEISNLLLKIKNSCFLNVKKSAIFVLKIKNSCFLNVKKSAIFSLKIEYVFPSNF